MTRDGICRGLGVLAMCAGAFGASPGWAQAAAQHPAIVTVEQPDAQRTKEEMSALLERYPPALRGVLALDASLVGNETYLVAFACAVGLMGACIGATSMWFQTALGRIASSLAGLKVRETLPSVAAILAGHGVLALAAGAALLLVPAAVYLAVLRD